MTSRNVLAPIALIMLLTGTSSFAATSPATIQVSLTGEGGSDMAINLDPSKVKAGKVTFDVTNEAVGESQEMVLIRLNDKSQTLPYLEDKHRVDESKVNSLGEVADLKAGDHGQFTAVLKPGAYELMCNVKGHNEAGMHTVQSVTK